VGPRRTFGRAAERIDAANIVEQVKRLAARD
jgi:hypothetical protein